MPRRNSPRRAGSPAARESPPAAALGWARSELAPDGEWLVRSMPGAQGGKTYRCPGCDHEIRPGTAHVVAWLAVGGGADERRHWHTGCWVARHRRRPTR